MPEPLDLFIVAGEPSGDVLGAALISELTDKVQLTMAGVGGHWMREARLDAMFGIEKLSVMGYRDTLIRLPALLWRAHKVIDAIVSAKPDVVVLIDYQEFSAYVARQVKARRPNQKIMLYVAPSVGIWRPERARKLAALYDDVLCILPHEPRVLAELGGPEGHYVRHPALGQVTMAPFEGREGQRVLLLPGSRPSVIRRHLPILASAVVRIRTAAAECRFVLPTLPTLAERLTKWCRDLGISADIVCEPAQLAMERQKATMAIACSGTVTLELALAGVPHVIFYQPDRRTYEKVAGKGLPLFGLPNIIMGSQITPEIAHPGEIADQVADASLALFTNPEDRRAQCAAFDEMRKRLEDGEPDAAPVSAADRVLALAGRSAG